MFEHTNPGCRRKARWFLTALMVTPAVLATLIALIAQALT